MRSPIRRSKADGAASTVSSVPAGRASTTRMLHGFENEGDVDVYMQTFIGSGKPGPVGYADDAIYSEERARLASRQPAG